jgi:hypothetical protein
VAFKESDDEFTKKHYLSDLSDTDIINRFVLLTDNYGNICNGEALDQKKYKIQRDPMKGTAVISININDQFYTHTYSGFKQANQQIANIDSTILRYNMIVDDLDQFQIKALLNASHQVSDIINQLHFTISSVQDQTQAKITIDQVSNPQMRDLYLYQSFLVTNLQPYYIKLKSHIEPNVLNRTPSTINTNLFRQKFLDISDEFCNRNNDTLLITLKVDKKSNTLIAKIS